MIQKKHCDCILTNGYLLTMDSERRIFSKGAIAVSGGAIAAVGREEEVFARWEGEILDCKGGIVHPGLVDAHVHLPMHLCRGWEPDTFTVDDTWNQFERYFFPNVTQREETAGIAFGVWELARNGITTFGDTGGILLPDSEPDLIAANTAGVRGIMGTLAGDCFNEELSFLSRPAGEVLRRMADDRKKYGAYGRVRIGVEVCGMGDSSDALVVGAKALAREYDDVLFMHQSAYESEVALYREKYGCTPVEHLYSLGVLDSKTTLVHMIRLTDHDVELLAETGTNVVHCPAASMKFGLGASSIGKFPEMAAKGVNIGLGNDSGTWSDGLDILTQAYLASMMHREARRELVPINSYKAFEMATIDGAKALGMEQEIGSLEVGKKADIVVHTADLPESALNFDPFMNLIYAARSKSVCHVMVEGEWIVRNGRSTRVDEEKLVEDCRRAAFAFAEKIGYHVKTPWKIIQ